MSEKLLCVSIDDVDLIRYNRYGFKGTDEADRKLFEQRLQKDRTRSFIDKVVTIHLYVTELEMELKDLEKDDYSDIIFKLLDKLRDIEIQNEAAKTVLKIIDHKLGFSAGFVLRLLEENGQLDMKIALEDFYKRHGIQPIEYERPAVERHLRVVK
jgi:hypothetical protein